MKQFIAGLITGGLIFCVVALYVYYDGNIKINKEADKVAQLEQATKNKPAAPATSSEDISTLAAELRNGRLEVLAETKGDDFDRNYIQILNTINGEVSTLAIEAMKRAATPEVRALADKINIESTKQQGELGPLRSRFSLID